MTGGGTIIDILRRYTGPRALALALLFIGAALVRIPTVLIAVVLHLCERGSDQLIAWAESIPPQPSRRRTRRRSGTRGDQA